MKEWNDFFVAVSGASAALTGLIFVGISISLTKILSFRGLPDRALLSLTLLVNVLVHSLLFLAPGLAIKTLGLSVLLISLLVWIIVFRLDFRNIEGKENQYKNQRLFNMLIDQLATISFVLTGIAITSGWINMEYWIIPAVVISFIKAIFDGWALLVEINR